ncbi:DNA-directed DNA polymerase [Thioalkalivibrio versutus]|uniref:DNA-directed DNA polymerase n=1 Tax=Thioalkalivibrio versutus TaxID=106634 RepID=A0A0G3G1I0_9GAMM|nr:DNA polymerase III subunit [Thioalkalivibrio versutus]AKJ95065.1 DNA-directed DNA polymerase [Thioalkalivibrio versutus]
MAAPVTDDTLPPWLQKPWEALARRGREGRLPSGLLVHGAPGVGKALLTRALVQALLCQRATGTEPPCGECNGCRSFLGGVHPEVMTLEPEEAGKEILIAAAREAIEFLSLSGSGGLRSVIIRPADALNTNAANALLKTLEEPPPRAMLILEAAQPARLPATIRSRCQMVEIATPGPAEATDWLRVAADDPAAVDEAYAASLGRPLAAREILTDPDRMARWEQDREALTLLLRRPGVTPMASAMQRSLPESLIPRIQALLVAAQRLLVNGEPDAFGRQFPRDRLEDFARRMGPRRLAELSNQALGWQRQASRQLNPQLRMEDIALSFLEQ